MLLTILLVLSLFVIFLYYKFICWVATRTNMDTCMTMFIFAILADATLLKGSTGMLMLILALVRSDIGNLTNNPRLSASDFKASKHQMMTRSMSQ
jgi:hypothetical protein